MPTLTITPTNTDEATFGVAQLECQQTLGHNDDLQSTAARDTECDWINKRK